MKFRKEKTMKKNQEFTEELGHSMPSSRRETEDDMLEELCFLAKKSAQITIPEICGRMEMTRREVLAYLKQLAAQGYVKMEEKNAYVCLTELGRIRGEECRHRHETFTQFLQYVGVGSSTAEEDACRMEHVASEETVQQICNFVNYGSTFERVMRNTDLRYRYEPGDYPFMMGIYYMEKTCPRRLAGEFKDYKEQTCLHVKKEDSFFELFCTSGEENRLALWYMDPETGWTKARRENGNPVIPTGIFEYFIRHHDPVIEGTALVAFAREGEKPMDWNSRELDVHIW